MQGCKSFSTLANANEKLYMDDGILKANEKLFRSLVRGLMYLTHTQLDIMFLVSLVSRFMCNPSVHHLGAARRILHYVRGTINYGIWYEPIPNFKLIGFTDSDWASFIDDRKSTRGFIFNIGSGVVSLSSKKQGSIALSLSQAEYIVVSSATCQAIWIR
ncbi:uncharacterized protein LOC109841867 [Asparagus officinalis]|uniref:uncharacterized protein LOC109841867 n=1 Tax=Asparagus officinalis TaxID=4686 RepID=UPI00098E7515|nr:uncharacterized protein LOC109841867 [Asparagus officinalis]